MRGGGAIWERSRGPLSPSDIHQAVNIRPPPVMQPIGPDWQGGYIHDIRLEGGGRGVRSVCVCVCVWTGGIMCIVHHMSTHIQLLKGQCHEIKGA